MNHMTRIILIGMMASALLFSCTYGTKNLNSEIVKNLKEGTTTKYDVAEYLGPIELVRDDLQSSSFKDELILSQIFDEITKKCCTDKFANVAKEGLIKARFMLKQLNLNEGVYSLWAYYRKFDTEDWLWPLPDTRNVNVLIVIFNAKNIVEKKIFIEDNQAYWWFVNF